MARNPKKQILTKKHLARLERERLQTRYIILATTFVAVLVIGLITYGLINEYVLKPQTPVAVVDGEKISVREFQANIRYNQQQIISNYTQNLSFYQMFGADASTLSSLQNMATQQLEASSLGNYVLESLIQDRLIRKYADANNISVTKDDIDKALHDSFGFYPAGTPTTQPTSPAIATSTLSPTQLALLPPTNTPEPTITPTTVITPEATSTPTVVPQPTSTSEPQPTPTQYTQDSYEANYKNYIKQLKDNLEIPEAIFTQIVANQLLRDKVMDVVITDVPHEEEQVWARHILVDSQEVAIVVLDRLKAGEDFASLAAEFSTDSSASSGGDLGWFGKGKMVAEFEQAAFSLGIGEISEPVQSQYGYHIIQVLGHENRPISDSEYQQLRQTLFSNWLQEQRGLANVEIPINWLPLVPTAPALPTLQ
jgi:peptidyl-prolyl cis-trans isomerase D